ncbi:M3 family metallopeptidase [Myroides sp. DF42-4-2]|uniref:M3 family metallopeptidase n=1 Tax=unclassified Myroides TaxID=2642485 RepID=UPI002577641C|nr:M3 family metallopeptidase [Myroides sp. DF42-4-2]MDM1407864.1 M3 family metallopeptidase [Myroides sp. DF42-4-2]
MYVKKVIISVAIGASLFSISCKNDAKWDETNAFYAESTLPYQTADFSKIGSKDFKPALLEGMRQQNKAIQDIIANAEEPTFTNTMEALELSGLLLNRVSNVFHLLTAANTNAELIAINNELAPKFAAHNDGIYLNDALFERVKKLNTNKDNLGLEPEQTRLIEVYYERFEQAGANLSAVDKEKLKKINQEIATLTNSFSDKLLAATKAGAVVFNAEQLEGVSPETLSSFKQGDNQYSLPLSNTTQQPISSQLQNAATREQLFKASWERAEKKDSNDTQELVIAIAKKRAEKARLLGFDTYAAWSLQGTMAQTPDQVFKMLETLNPHALEAAKEEGQIIQEMIQKKGESATLNAADWSYYAEILKKEKYTLDQEELKSYFLLNKVLEDGVFYMAKYLYGISYLERTDIPVWHEDVKVYEFFNQDGSPLGLFYTDYYQRDSKQGGAWMSNIVDQSYLTKQLPVVYNVANFPKPAEGNPTLLSLDEVITLFHEFGHALHGLFAAQTYPTLSGTNVSRDFVEFPSQFHEHFAFDPAILSNYAKHYQTGYILPKELEESIYASAGFNKGYDLTELLAAAVLDLAWHSIDADATITDIHQFETDALTKYNIYSSLVPPRYRSTYFSHIFGGGYAAGYYSYKWSQMIDYDAYAWLMEQGGISLENGTILRKKLFSQGNTLPLDKLYRDFREKDPTVDAYLHYAGFTK